MPVSASHQDRVTYATILAAMALGLALRLHGLTTIELDYDEAATGYFAALPFTDLWTGPAWLEPNPPLFYTFAGLINRLGGSVEQLRLVSVIAGVLTIPVGAALAWCLAGRFAAGAAALLLALSARDIAMSQYARSYELLALTFLAATLGLVLARNHRAGWALYIITTTAALYTHNIAPFVLLVINLAMLLSLLAEPEGARRFLRGWLAANVLVALLYLPWVPVLLFQAKNPLSLAWIPKPDLEAVITQMHLVLGQPALSVGQPWIDMAFIAAVWLAVWQMRTRAIGPLLLLAAIVAAPALLFAVSQYRPLLNGKTLLWIGPIGLVAAGIGCTALGRLRIPTLAALVALHLWGAYDAADAHSEQYRPLTAMLREKMRPADTVYVSTLANTLLLDHYGWPRQGVDVVGFDQNEEPWFRNFPGRILPQSAIPADAAQHARVWIITRQRPKAQQELGAAITLPRVLDEHFGGLEAQLFARP